MSDIEVRELHPGHTEAAFEAMAELRRGLPVASSRALFVDLVDRVQRAQGYRLAGAFLPGEDEAAAAIGFRRTHMLAWGDAFYVDDLATRPDFRRRGCADALLRWVFAEADKLGLDGVHLDSGTHRHDAHRLYLNHGFTISSYHFRRDSAS